MELPPVISSSTVENSALGEKISLLHDNFKGKFGGPPQFVARVPGR